MTFPTVAASSNGNNATAAAAQALTLPSGIAAGHLLLAGCVYVINSGNSGVEPTWPAGWTKLIAIQTGGFEGVWGMLAYRVADGSEGSTVTVTGPDNTCRAAWQIHRLTGYSGVPTATATTGGFSASVNPPNHTSTFGAVDALWFAYAFGSSNTVAISAYPSSYTNGAQQVAASGSGGYIANARRQLSTASEDPATYTVTVEPRWAAITAAVMGVTPDYARVTQAAVEVLDQSSTVNARVTQAAVEVLEAPSTVNVRVTQAAVEVLLTLTVPSTGPPMRVPTIIGG